MTPGHPPQLHVLIAGAGVAGLETALALAELAPERVRTTLLDPSAEFVLRPLAPRVPFNRGAAPRYRLDAIAREIGAELVTDGLRRVDAPQKTVYTTGGAALRYDVLVLALGAGRKAAFPHGVTIDDQTLDQQLHGMVQDVEAGYVPSVAFVAPSTTAWPLPLYELALMTAAAAAAAQTSTKVTLITPEDTPLAIFGNEASAAVAARLRDNGVQFIGSAHASVPEAGMILIYPGSREIHAQSIVALPQLFGPRIAGVPRGAPGGFIRVDPLGTVEGVSDTYAAGDATDFPIKHGGIGAQQADTVAQVIAARAGASLVPRRFTPEIDGLLLGGGPPLYLSAHVTGGHGSTSRASEAPLWEPGAKIVAAHLTSYLARLDATRPLAFMHE